LHSGNFNRQHSEEGRVVALADEWFFEHAARTVLRNLRDLALGAVEFARDKRRSDGASCWLASIRGSGLVLVSARRGCSLFAAGGATAFELLRGGTALELLGAAARLPLPMGAAAEPPVGD
jgi:hypothetical protein